MLSILIPTYNYNITRLVKELHKQCVLSKIVFEILVYEDGSKSTLNKENKKINQINNCFFKELDKNIGRSAIRNLLANDSKYNALLFIDAGTFPAYKNFVSNYLNHGNYMVLSGGMIAEKKAPRKPFKLRWLYTKHREKNEFCSSNFLIQKKLMLKFPFNESLKKYGYEDVLLFSDLKQNKIDASFISNPVIHHNDDDAKTFIKKTEEALGNLIAITNNGLIDKKISKIYSYHLILKKIKLTLFISKLFIVFRKILIYNFNSSFPILFFYDFYRLGYICYLKTK